MSLSSRKPYNTQGYYIHEDVSLLFQQETALPHPIPTRINAQKKNSS